MPTTIQRVENFGGNRITNVGTPTSSTDAATKAYIDAAIAALGGGGSTVATSTWLSNTTLSAGSISSASANIAAKATASLIFLATSAAAGTLQIYLSSDSTNYALFYPTGSIGALGIPLVIGVNSFAIALPAPFNYVEVLSSVGLTAVTATASGY
jgi:hypothetical protein